jgi:hypothetical protein
LAAKATNTALATTNTAVALKAPIASPVFTGNVGIGVSPSYKLDVDAGAPSSADKIISRHMAETSRQLGLVWDDSASTMGIATLTNHSLSFHTNGINPRMTISNAGIVTKPYQPAFLAQGNSTLNLPINTDYVIPYGTERFDQNADFNPATYTFTAPVTGKYQLNASLYLTNVDYAALYVELRIETSNRSYYSILSVNVFDQDATYFTMPHTVLADMDAGDTAFCKVYIHSGSVVTDLSTNSLFSGFLAC